MIRKPFKSLVSSHLGEKERQSYLPAGLRAPARPGMRVDSDGLADDQTILDQAPDVLTCKEKCISSMQISHSPVAQTMSQCQWRISVQRT